MSLPTQSVAPLLDALGIEEPAARQLMASVLMQSQGNAKPSRDNGRRQSKASEQWRARAIRAERHADAMAGKLEALACALGTCPDCWGEDPDCQECGGLGKPGEFLPDMACFQTYVTPVLSRMQEQLARPGHDSADHGAFEQVVPAEGFDAHDQGDLR